MRFTKISDGTDPDGDGQVIQNLVISVNGTAAVSCICSYTAVTFLSVLYCLTKLHYSLIVVSVT